MSSATGPHTRIATSNARDRRATSLFDRLWETYRRRVSHVGVYERIVRDAGGTFVNDHIAFRTFATQSSQAGIVSISRLIEALGYRALGCYDFPDKNLSAIHFQHPIADFPKLFISELRVWELPADVRRIVLNAARQQRTPFADDDLVALSSLSEQSASDEIKLLDRAVKFFHDLPWPTPEKSDVEQLNRATQYAAWVLAHGYNVNHFTALINSHGVAALDDIEKTIAALRQAGVPMKAEIEGERGSILRQTATDAAVIDLGVRDHGRETTMPWTYAYFELAERGFTSDASGQRRRFEGFLGAQATQLFEMTKLKS